MNLGITTRDQNVLAVQLIIFSPTSSLSFLLLFLLPLLWAHLLMEVGLSGRPQKFQVGKLVLTY